jgi:hypothetical protein
MQTNLLSKSLRAGDGWYICIEDRDSPQRPVSSTYNEQFVALRQRDNDCGKNWGISDNQFE